MRTEIEIEKQRRICVALWAYAYELKSHSIVPDSKFDETCKAIRPSLCTGDDDLDFFFMMDFDPSTGQWIHRHPKLDGIESLYNRLKETKALEG